MLELQQVNLGAYTASFCQRSTEAGAGIADGMSPGGIQLIDLATSWVPWIARRSNQSTLKEISPEYSVEGLIDAEAETLILWPPDAKSWLIRKDPDAGKDWGQEEKVMMEDEMVGWHHRLNGYEFE